MTEYEKPRILSVTAQHVAELERENAKLRELLAELYESARLEHPSAFERTYGDRMRELGVDA